MLLPRDRTYFRRLLERIHRNVRGTETRHTRFRPPAWYSRCRMRFQDGLQRRLEGWGSAILVCPERMGQRFTDLWHLLRRSNVMSFSLFLVGIALLTFLQSSRFTGPASLIIGAKGSALGMLLCSTVAYGFGLIQAALRNRASPLNE